ncbi:Transcriptional regulator [Pseudoalteromonas luteoviolacea B = ATCC 29581]|nr:Transcriptional regulator [Pseudoalteromonas luteoviolacea B = ATCC 29581]
MQNYPNKHFIETDLASLYELIERFPLATLICHSHDAVFLPLQLSACKTKLFGHAAKNNPVLGHTTEPLNVIFHGESYYVSPNLVPQQTLPTWHYKTVHVKGTLSRFDTDASAWENLAKQVRYFEQSEETPWQADSLSTKQRTALLQHIDVFSIDIFSIKGHFKFSQNKSREHQNAIAHAIQRTNACCSVHR